MRTRIVLSPRDPTITCAQCGHPSLHLARVVSENGDPLGQTLVCPFCRPQQAGASDQFQPEADPSTVEPT